MKPKTLIGRKDVVSFPEWGLKKIAAKVDTGAYRSAIHCHHIEEYDVFDDEFDEDDEYAEPIETRIRFTLFDPSHPQYDGHVFETADYEQKRVKSSFGVSELRFVVTTKIVLFGRKLPVEISLSERGEMKFPVLLGRKLLMGKFIVDPSKYDLSLKKKK